MISSWEVRILYLGEDTSSRICEVICNNKLHCKLYTIKCTFITLLKWDVKKYLEEGRTYCFSEKRLGGCLLDCYIEFDPPIVWRRACIDRMVRGVKRSHVSAPFSFFVDIGYCIRWMLRETVMQPAAYKWSLLAQIPVALSPHRFDHYKIAMENYNLLIQNYKFSSY